MDRYEPGTYTMVLNYNGGSKTVATWMVRPLSALPTAKVSYTNDSQLRPLAANMLCYEYLERNSLHWRWYDLCYGHCCSFTRTQIDQWKVRTHLSYSSELDDILTLLI